MAKQRHNLHSFTLWPRASQIVTQVSSGRKSQYVSKAIIWFAEPQEVISEKEYTEDGVIPHHQVLDLSEQIMNHQALIERYRKVCIENEKLLEELRKNESFISKMLKLFRK